MWLKPCARLTCLASVATLVGLSACEAYSRGDTAGDTQPTLVDELSHPYETVGNWGDLPDGREWGSVSAIEADPDGRHIWVADRCGSSCAGSELPAILKFDLSGELLASFGVGILIWPHGIHVDVFGNVWVADGRAASDQELERSPEAGEKGHQVIKFSPDGDVLLRLGIAGVAGNEPPYLNSPNDVVTAPNGDIFVAESHDDDGPQRILKFSSDGTFIKSWGGIGSGPGEFQPTPHSIVMDSEGRLFVADRGNKRIQIFDQEGNFLDEWYQFSRPDGLYIDADDVLYAADSGSSADTSQEYYYPGWRRGIYVGSVRDGKVTAFIPPLETADPEGSMGEGVTVDGEGNVYSGMVTASGAGAPPGIMKHVRRLQDSSF